MSKSKSKFLPSPFLVNRAAPISVSLAFGLHSCAITVNATVGGWPSGSTLCFNETEMGAALFTKNGEGRNFDFDFDITHEC